MYTGWLAAFERPPTRFLMSAMPTPSLSSCWCSHRHTDGEAMAAEIAALGFETMELSHGIRVSLLPGVLRAVQQGIIRVSSVHNFCPLPPGILHPAPNLFEPTSPSARERESWLRYTQRTIETAAKTGASRIVLHGGSVRLRFGKPDEKVEEAAAGRSPAELAADEKYQQVMAKAQARIAKKVPDTLKRLEESLLQAAEAAGKVNVQLCLENREALVEMPPGREMAALQERLHKEKPGVFGYWHDTGHAHLKEMLGLSAQEKLLQDNARWHAGWHLHDVIAGKDHWGPGVGEIDWTMTRRFLRAEHTVVVELSPRVEEEDVRAARVFAEQWIAQEPAARS